MRQLARILIAVLVVAGAARANPTPCWDGTGPAIEGDTTQQVLVLAMTAGYPGRIAIPDAAERARRSAVLAARNHGFTFTIGDTGDITLITTSRMSCASSAAVQAKGPKGIPPSPNDTAVLQELTRRNADVMPGANLLVSEFGVAADGSPQMSITNQGPSASHLLATTVRAHPMTDAQTLAAFARISRIELVRVSHGDSCGPQCGPPPVSTTVLGSRAITASDATVNRYTAIYQTPQALVVRKIAMLQLRKPDTRLSTGLTMIDAVTGEKLSTTALDIFE